MLASCRCPVAFRHQFASELLQQSSESIAGGGARLSLDPPAYVRLCRGRCSCCCVCAPACQLPLARRRALLHSTPVLHPMSSHAVVSYASLFYYEGLSLSARSETDLISASQPATRARRTALLCSAAYGCYCTLDRWPSRLCGRKIPRKECLSMSNT